MLASILAVSPTKLAKIQCPIPGFFRTSNCYATVGIPLPHRLATCQHISTSPGCWTEKVADLCRAEPVSRRCHGGSLPGCGWKWCGTAKGCNQFEGSWAYSMDWMGTQGMVYDEKTHRSQCDFHGEILTQAAPTWGPCPWQSRQAWSMKAHMWPVRGGNFLRGCASPERHHPQPTTCWERQLTNLNLPELGLFLWLWSPLTPGCAKCKNWMNSLTTSPSKGACFWLRC